MKAARIRQMIGWLRELLPKPKPRGELRHPGVVPVVKPPPVAKPQTNITMYDSIEVSVIPAGAEAVAGYVDGRWKTYNELLKHFPKAHHLSIAVFAQDDATCCDCEKGDLTADQVPDWVKRQKARGVKRPVVYASLSEMAGILVRLQAAGIPRREVRIWTAHYSYKSHICTKNCGYGLGTTADATQWTDRALGRNLDQSLCKGSFFA